MMKSQLRICMSLCGVVLFLATAAPLSASAVFFGPTPYLSSADIPTGFYAGGSPTFLEDFEDGALDGGITATSVGGFGSISIQTVGELVDSVDADDGVIDGSGSDGSDIYQHLAFQGIRFTLSSPFPTAAALVWTDGPAGGADFTFEAFGPGMTSLGSIPLVTLGDGLNTGQTAEDRFFGVQDLGGIEAIHIVESGVVAGGLEVDHVQFGAAVPEPTSIALVIVVAVAGLFSRRR